jgi:small subunit ribosomal protein S8
MSDPIADMLTRIRNAHMVNKTTVSIPASKLKEAIVKVLVSEGYINSYSVNGEAATKTIDIELKYYNNKAVISKINRISKPSLRVYTSSANMPEVMNGLGIVIISTPKGVMSGSEAKTLNVGGEVLCSVE